MQSLDKWWAESPFERRPELPSRDLDDYVPVELQFQRAAHDANLGKQTSDLMRLSPLFFQRFGASDTSLHAHLGAVLDGMWEYLTADDPYRAPKRLYDVWDEMQRLLDQGEPMLCVSI